MKDYFDDLRKRAEDAEAEYLRLLNLKSADKKYSSLNEALANYLKSKNKLSLSHKSGIEQETAIAMIRELEKNNNTSMKYFMNKKFSNFIAREIGQIQSLDINEKDVEKRTAGYLDEVFSAIRLEELLGFQTVSITREEDGKDIFENYKIQTNLTYTGQGRAGDFTLHVKAEGEDSGIFKAADIKTEGNIHFENKLNLHKFHIDDGSIQTLGRDLDKLLDIIIKTIDYSAPELALGDVDIDIIKSTNTNNAIIQKLIVSHDKIHQALAGYILERQIASKFPIFISAASDGLDFKLCSTIIDEFAHNQNIDINSGLKKGERFTVVETSQNTKKELAEKAIKKINTYNLWYGK